MSDIEKMQADAALADWIIWSCVWFIPVVVLMWAADQFWNKDARWVFLWGFLFGPIGALLSVVVQRPRGEDEELEEDPAVVMARKTAARTKRMLKEERDAIA